MPIPPFSIQNLPYHNYDPTLPQGTKAEKPHIVFNDPKFKPLADFLNWRFPYPFLLRDTLAYLERPWNALVDERKIESEWANLAIRKDGRAQIVTVMHPDSATQNVEVLNLTVGEITDVLIVAIAEADKINRQEPI